MNPSSPEKRAGSYLYCIVPARPLANDNRLAEVEGIGGQHYPVRIISGDGLAAVVSDVAVSRVDISRQNVLAHERVIENIMSHVDVLPCSFGTVAASDEAIQVGLLRSRRDELLSQLERVRGHVELGLRVLWERERLLADILGEDERIQRLRSVIAAQPEGAAYYERITLGQLVAAAIEQRSEREAATLLADLQPLSTESRANNLVGDMMILNAAFLVERDRVPAFDERVNALAEASAGRLIFRYTRSLPPYNFVDIAPAWEG